MSNVGQKQKNEKEKAKRYSSTRKETAKEVPQSIKEAHGHKHTLQLKPASSRMLQTSISSVLLPMEAGNKWTQGPDQGNVQEQETQFAPLSSTRSYQHHRRFDDWPRWGRRRQPALLLKPLQLAHSCLGCSHILLVRLPPVGCALRWLLGWELELHDRDGASISVRIE